MIFRQLFEPVSCTYSYLLACPDTIDTPIHADHLTGALKLKHLTGSRICGPAMDRLPCADVGLREGEPPKNLNRGTSEWRATVAGAALQHRES